MILSGLFIKKSTGKEVSFFVPEDHEKYAYFDSLYREIESTGQKASQLEKRVILEKGLLGSNMTVKGQYFDHLLQNKLCDTLRILKYCKAAKKNYEVKELYFDNLLTIMKGDDRANCFLYLKHARGELAKVTSIIYKYTAQNDADLNVIEYDKKEKLKIDEPEIKDPSLDDILGPIDDEDPFKNVEENK
jgi:hypothetical protein